MRVGILSQWFPPESGPASIPGVLARGLVKLGHDVTVLTGYPNYPTGSLYDGYSIRPWEDHHEHGYAIRRVALYPDHSAKISSRLLNYGSFAVSAAALGTSVLKGIDVLWVYNSPATVALPMWLAKGRYRVPIVLHNMDMWPDSVVHTGFAPAHGGRLLLGTLDRWVRAMYRSANLVAYITPSAGDELFRRGVPRAKLRYSPVWVDGTIFRPRDGSDLRRSLGFSESEIVIGYAGALGRAQGVVDLTRAVLDLPESIPIRCLILGSGTESDHLEEIARDHPSRISFLGQVPHEAMAEYSAVPDISFVGLSPGPQANYAAPSKVNAIMACGKPLLAATGGDTAEMITRTGTGFTVPPGDASALRAALVAIAAEGRQGLADRGRDALAFSRAELSTEVGIRRVAAILSECSIQEGRRK